LDLHFTSAEATADERAAIDQALAAHLGPSAAFERSSSHFAAGGRAARSRRHLLLPVLHAISSRVGWISEGALNYACHRLDVPPADAYGVATFYGLFSVVPRPPTVVHVCDDVACIANGAARLCDQLESRFGPAGRGDSGSGSTWLRSPCLGLCERAPAALLAVAGTKAFERPVAPASIDSIAAALQTRRAETNSTDRLPQAGDGALRLLRRVGHVDPHSLESYRSAGGYEALRKAIELGPQRVIDEVKEAKLMGRGGAAFPAGRKWEAVAKEPARPHYLVCNADESEPGTFKDRILMEDDPFALVEAMTIAALAGGCEHGFVYVRGEYPLAAERVGAAVSQARAAGLLGDNIMGAGLRFDVELRRGAGAYICGEETALFNSIEGLRGEPRNKPPFPVQKGLFGKPTIVNNVETLVNVLDIVRDGGSAFAAIGTPESTGPKLFCLSGSVKRPGLYEVPFGTRLKDLIALAGGVRGRELQAVLLGGAAGTFVTPAELDVALSFEGVRAIGATLGSGAVIVFDETVDLRAIVLRVAAFFRDESCGQCVPCRVGTARQEELVHRLAANKPLGSVEAERVLLAEIGQAMRDASICGLGQTASGALESALSKLALFNGSKP
jgi:NADH-quinone oxidoreductase subunit F